MLGLAACIACNRTDEKNYAQLTKTDEFPTQTSAQVDTFGIDLIAGVSQLMMSDNSIWMQADGAPMWLYSLNPDNLTVVDSLFKKGQGPGEYIFATITPAGKDEFLIVDNGKMAWSTANRNNVIESGSTGRFIVSAPRVVSFPAVGFVDFRADGLRLRLRDFNTGAEIDSLSIPNRTVDGESVPDNFVWDYDPQSQRFALAFTSRNELLTGNLTDKGFDNIKVYSGESEDGHFYYTDIHIDGNKLIALNQRNVDLQTHDGFSAIEIYSLDCEPEKLINLPVIAQTILPDLNRSRILMTSATDDVFYSVSCN